jgi:hypothetical protein
MLRNLLRRWLLNKDLDQNIIELYSEHRTILQLFGEMTKRVYRAEGEISKLRGAKLGASPILKFLERKIDALEATLDPFKIPPVRQEGALWLRSPSDAELNDLVANFPADNASHFTTRKRALFEFGRQWQSMRTTGKIISCDKSAADANAISEALSKLCVPVNPGNNGDQPDRLSDSPDA